MNCDLGHNRSPTLALAFLVLAGQTLREAYRSVLRARPSVDPLPTYRRALLALEVRRIGSTTVSAEERPRASNRARQHHPTLRGATWLRTSFVGASSRSR